MARRDSLRAILDHNRPASRNFSMGARMQNVWHDDGIKRDPRRLFKGDAESQRINIQELRPATGGHTAS
jgi:hypothetical protein